MREYTPERAGTDLQELNVILGAWYNNRESDSVFIQEHRDHEYWVGVRFMRDVMYGVQPEHLLQLKIGETAIKTATFKELEPGHELDFRKEDVRIRHRLLTPSWAPTEELFVGWRDRVPMSEVARTIKEGGELRIVEAPTQPSRSLETPARA